jgi:hypothetical protein
MVHLSLLMLLAHKGHTEGISSWDVALTTGLGAD